jgi:hypothetical protein
MAVSAITFMHGETVHVEGDVQTVIDALHEVASRRVHSFAVLVESGGDQIAVRPEAVAHVRPSG